MIVIVIGMFGFGKSKIVKEFEKRGFLSVFFGDIVREEILKCGFEFIKENVVKVSIWLRQEFGQNVVVKFVVEKVRVFLKGLQVVVIDGVCFFDEVGIFRGVFLEENIIIVVVYILLRQCFERFKVRGRYDDLQIWEDFEERDWKEFCFGIGGVIVMVDYMLVNNGFREEYEVEVKKFVDEIILKF